MNPLDFTVIGLPKAATSSLYNWLNSHPQIQGSQPKETFFFMDADHPLARLDSNYNIQGIDAYKQFFRENKYKKIQFEATTHYFYQQTAINYLSSMEIQPLIVAVLRKPSARIHSSFRYTKENLAYLDKSVTFNEYVDCLLNENMRKLEPYYYSESSFQIASMELELNRYSYWLDKWLNKLQPGKLHLILFEEMRKSPGKVVKDLCARLGVNPNYYDGYDFKAKNRTITIKNQSLHRFAKKWGSRLPATNVKKKLKSLYFQYQHGTDLEDSDTWSEGVAKLDKYFELWNKELEKKYNLDLELWNKKNK